MEDCIKARYYMHKRSFGGIALAMFLNIAMGVDECRAGPIPYWNLWRFWEGE